MRRYTLLLGITLFLGLLATAATILAASGQRESNAAAVVVEQADSSRDGDRHCRVRVIKGDGKAETVEIDLSGLGQVIGAAMRDVSAALAELDTVQVVSERGGKRLVIREDDHEAVIDVDAIMREVNQALAVAFNEVGDHARHARRELRERNHREPRETVRREVREDARDDRAALRAEIADLRAELTVLREELEMLRASRRR